jgi:hypothetical protein
MFQRLARNFIRNGYFPTDSETLSRLLSALVPADSGEMRILDPAAGEGTALAECKQHLGSDRTLAYGIEFDEERAWHAKSLLDRCLHADFQNCAIGKCRFGLLFLNPPYGDLIADKGETGTAPKKGRLRLEKLFLSRSLHTLQFDGVLALIVPSYSLDKDMSQMIATYFSNVKVFLAPETRFKQVVIFGVRTRFSKAEDARRVSRQLQAIGQGDLPPVLPETWSDAPYVIPAITENALTFYSATLDAKQVEEEIGRYPCLWPQFADKFSALARPTRRPLMALSPWHLALALAAGQVAGVVTSKDGRQYLIKGDTHKEKVRSSSFERAERGETVEVITQLDRFIPVIRALDMTPHSSQFGDVLTIR